MPDGDGHHPGYDMAGVRFDVRLHVDLLLPLILERVLRCLGLLRCLGFDGPEWRARAAGFFCACGPGRKGDARGLGGGALQYESASTGTARLLMLICDME